MSLVVGSNPTPKPNARDISLDRGREREQRENRE